MANKAKFQAIRGTRDLLPPETALWNRVEQTAHAVFATYGFGEIRPPILEQKELFSRSIGAETDVVAKEMYIFGDPRLTRLERLRGTVKAEGATFWPSDVNSVDLFSMAVGKFVTALDELLNAEESESYDREQFVRRSVDLNQELAKFAQLASQGLPSEFQPQLTKSKERVETILGFFELGESLALRPEATASVCRAYIEHNMQQLPQPVKLYYMGPMFRRERPQKGRYRQFYQIGAELIEMLMTFFAKRGLEGATLDINSSGHAADNCRRGYVAKLREELIKVKDKLAADSQRRIETNPLRVPDSKLEHEQAIIATLPRIADHLCDECKAHYAAVKHDLDLRGVAYHENWRLVRGLDYYMRTTFEITARGLGSQNAVCGGGRYDGLVELLGGPPTKGIGFAIGEDRLILSLQESGKGAAPQGRDVYIAWMGEKTYATAIRAAKSLRDAGFSVELPPVEQKFGKALERASKLGARHALILGENEVASGEWTLKTLGDGSQQKLAEQALLEYLQKL